MSIGYLVPLPSSSPPEYNRSIRKTPSRSSKVTYMHPGAVDIFNFPPF